MKLSCSADGAVQNQLNSVIQRNKQERLATAKATSEVLAKLNVSIDGLPPKCQQLTQIAKALVAADIELLNPIAISLQQSKLTSEQLTQEYEILKLQQKEKKLQAKIDRNNKFLDELRKELECSKKSLMLRSPNPETIQEDIRQLKQKLAAYEESYEKTMTKYTKLSITDAIMPKSIVSLAETLTALKTEASELQARADDVTLVRQARHTLKQLKSGASY